MCRALPTAASLRGAALMLDSRPMSDLRLRFSDGDQPDLPLGAGIHVLGRSASGLGAVDAGQPWLLQICNDRRGLWLNVADGLRGVHVNGRPVRQVAMLRPGDSIHVDGDELLLLSAGDRAHAAPPIAREGAGNSRLLLRGVAGANHGRCINLEKPRRIGSAADADLRIDGERIAATHAVIEARNGLAYLTEAAADVHVNGQRLRQAVLRNGDQIAFDAQHRFVLEGPPPASEATSSPLGAFAEDADLPPLPPRRHWTQRIPWLLVAAVLLAGALSALLLFGTR